LAPNVLVENCSWFAPVAGTSGPTRAQRIKFAIQGGISDDSLDSLEFDLDELQKTIKEIKNIIDSLSKYTHINPENYDLTETEIETKSQVVLDKFALLVETINQYRDHLKKYLDDIIEENMIDTVISNSYENIDMLAPHFSLNYGIVEDYHVIEISDIEIILKVIGSISVTLQYGSRQERRNDNGLDLNENFPYETHIRYTIEDEFPNDNFAIDPFDVDTSSWYGDDMTD